MSEAAATSTAPAEGGESTAPVTSSAQVDIKNLSGDRSENLSGEGNAPTASAPVGSLIGDGSIQPGVGEPVIGGDDPGQGAPEVWYDKLGDKYKDNPNITKYGSLEAALDGNLNLVEMIGKKGIERPDENASPEVMEAWYDRIGRPKSVDDYSEWTAPEGLEDFTFDQEAMSEAKKRFHAAGMTDNQMKVVQDVFAETTMGGESQLVERMHQEAIDTSTELKRRYGDNYEHKMRSITAVADSLGIKEDLNAMGLGNNLNAILMLERLGSMVGESNITGSKNIATGGFSAERDRLNTKLGSMNRSHPEYQATADALTKLYKNKK